MFQMMGVFAEFERAMIQERVRAGLARARSEGFVFVTGFDPIKAGLVASLNRPGGNITGVHVFLIGLEGKRLGLLRELVPQAVLMGLLVNPRSPDSDAQSKGLKAAKRTIG